MAAFPRIIKNALVEATPSINISVRVETEKSNFEICWWGGPITRDWHGKPANTQIIILSLGTDYNDGVLVDLGFVLCIR